MSESYLVERIRELEDRLNRMAQEIRGLKDAVGKARQDVSMGGWPGAGTGGGAIQVVYVTTTGTLASGTPASPTTCGGTRYDTGASVTVTNVLAFASAYPSGKVLICLFDGVTYLAVSGSC